MENRTTLLTLCLFLSIIINTSSEISHDLREDDHDHNGRKIATKKLFVFGDSYVDTGNSKKATAVSWKAPYGMTFPGQPTGRFSDGCVLTDFLASFLGIKSPVPYRDWKLGEKSKLKYGMNFAFGGTGVFNTMEREPNMSVQIDFFEELVRQNSFTEHDLNSSVALVSVAGNDYATFLANNGGHINLEKDLTNLTKSIVKQLVVNVKRIGRLGVGKIAVTGLEPLGCLPPFSASSSYQNCSHAFNSLADFHNQILSQSLQDISGEQAVVVLDLYSAVMSAFKSIRENTRAGNNKIYNNPLKPCCVGVKKEHSCGSVDGNGEKKYSVCSKPHFSFFWDTIHPSQNAWALLFSALVNSLHNFGLD